VTCFLSELLHANANGRRFPVQEDPRTGKRKHRGATFQTARFVIQLSTMIVALASAGLVAMAAHALRLLTASGAVAATLVGAAAVIGGYEWVVLLLFFFASSSAVSHWRAAERERRVGPLVWKAGRRDAIQVLANGGVFGLAAVLSSVTGSPSWHAIGIGAIAAATADTWSTEIGTVLGGTPRMILGWREVAPGTSGGITIAGSVAAVVAALLASLVAGSVHWDTPMRAVAAGGIAGSLVDSVLGATVQERRWCPDCSTPTERRIHSCGTTTLHRGGIRGCDNDTVNLITTIAGAVVTWTLT
jgi:uncharacterized protein (TIGR00297 family)